jgi:hypothetical protein
MKACAALREVGVESTTQTFVGGYEHQQVTLIAALIEKWMMKVFICPVRELA